MQGDKVYFLFHFFFLQLFFNVILEPNYSELLLSQSVIKLSLHSVLGFFSNEGDL